MCVFVRLVRLATPRTRRRSDGVSMVVAKGKSGGGASARSEQRLRHGSGTHARVQGRAKEAVWAALVRTHASEAAVQLGDVGGL